MTSARIATVAIAALSNDASGGSLLGKPWRALWRRVRSLDCPRGFRLASGDRVRLPLVRAFLRPTPRGCVTVGNTVEVLLVRLLPRPLPLASDLTNGGRRRRHNASQPRLGASLLCGIADCVAR